MIKAIINGIISLILDLVNVLLVPIDSLIDTVLPNLSSAISAVGNFLSILTRSIGWGISALGIPSSAISLLIAFYTFKLTAPLLFSTIKLALKWYNNLKL